MERGEERGIGHGRHGRQGRDRNRGVASTCSPKVPVLLIRMSCQLLDVPYFVMGLSLLDRG